MKKKDNICEGLITESELQCLVKFWLTKEEKECELTNFIRQQRKSKVKNNIKTKQLKEMSEKLNKIERYILREESPIFKSEISDINVTRDLHQLLFRANQWFKSSKKSKADLNRIQGQVSTLYNSGAEWIEKRLKNQELLNILKKEELKIQQELCQSQKTRKNLQNELEIKKIEHELQKARLIDDA